MYIFCLASWINVGLIYHGGGQVQDFPSFYWGWDFLREFGTRPGGAAEYGSAFLAQALYSATFGALVLTLQAAVVYACLAAILRMAGAGKFRSVGFVPALLFLAVYCKYRHYSTAITSFAAGMLVAWVWWRFGHGKDWWRLAFALALVALLYPVAPSGLFVLVPTVLAGEARFWKAHPATKSCIRPMNPMAAHDPLSGSPSSSAVAPNLRGSSWMGIKLLGWAVVAGLVPWAEGAALFGFSPGEAYAQILPQPWDPVVLKLPGISFLFALYCLPSLLCLAVIVWRLFFRARRKPIQPGEAIPAQPSESGNERSVRSNDRWKWETGLSIVMPLLVVWLTLNPRIKALMEVDFFAWQGRWSDVLKAAQANPRYPLVGCAVVQASYHLGNLTGRLPNVVSAGELLLSDDKQPSHWKQSDIYYDLGYLNMALHHLTEAVEFYGERPPLLRRLALVNLALTNLSTARVYLGTLAKAPFQNGWACDYLELLKIDPTLDRDPEITRLRRLMVKQDSVVALAPDQQLLMLLGANRQNRMAFEYLMTYYLLTKNLEGFVRQLPRLRDFPDLSISPMWDEALELAGRLAGRAVRVPGHTINREATTRVETVTRLVQQYGDKAEQARPKLAAEYGQTYTFYWWFHE